MPGPPEFLQTEVANWSIWSYVNLEGAVVAIAQSAAALTDVGSNPSRGMRWLETMDQLLANGLGIVEPKISL